MLVSYSVKGFKSIKENIDINLSPTNYKMLSDRNISNHVLKGAMFVGANGSGKSNVVLALKLLLDMLFAKRDISVKNDYCLFSKEKNIHLIYEFNIQSTRIVYEIDFNYITTHEELRVNEELVLSRVGNFATTVLTEKKTYENISDDGLFLRDIYFNTNFREHDALREWFEFLKNSVYIDMYSFNKSETYKDITLDMNDYIKKNGTEEINAFLTKYKFDQQIVDVNHLNIDYLDKSNEINNYLSENINEFKLTKDWKNRSVLDNDLIIELTEFLNERTSINPDRMQNLVASMIRNVKDKIFVQRDGVDVFIPFELESLGNRNLLKFLPALFHVIKHGGLLLVDEFSSGFHNSLEELLLNYFMDNATNSQMIFVSHSTNLMDNTLLRPDQIYVVEFHGMDGSSINRISKYQPREAQNVEKMYLGGVFGGLPNYEEEAEQE